MAENSKIEWTTHTFNPWIGCQKVSPGMSNNPTSPNVMPARQNGGLLMKAGHGPSNFKR